MKMKKLTMYQITLIAAAAGVICNIALASVKLSIGLSTNSLAILSDSINNFCDTASCIIALLAFYFINKKANSRFAFGYGRIEYLAAFVISVIVTAVGAQFFISAVERFLYPYPIMFVWLYFGILLGTVAVKLLVGIFFKKVYDKTGSPVIRALYLDSFMDAAITLMAVISFIVTKYGNIMFDAIFGLIISIFIIIGGAKLIKSSVSSIIGGGGNAEAEKRIKEKLTVIAPEFAFVSYTVEDYGRSVKHAVLEVGVDSGVTAEVICNLANRLAEEVKSCDGTVLKVVPVVKELHNERE